MRIIVSGLTAAGKTTHATELSRALGCELVTVGQLLARLNGAAEFAWSPDVDESRRSDSSSDRIVDQWTVDYLAEHEDCVVDSWAAPWLSQNVPAIRVWIESDLESRIWKAMVTGLRRGEKLSQNVARSLVAEKDAFARDRFLELYQFDLMNDREPFDIIVVNSPFISFPSIAESDRGIDEFNPIFQGAIARAANSLFGAELALRVDLTESSQFVVRCPGGM